VIEEDQSMPSNSIDSLLHEERRFPPSESFTSQAVASQSIYDEASADRLGFWANQARTLLHWHKDFTETLDWSNPPFAKWFADGKINVAYNCLDRHVEAGNGDRIAIHWEGEPGDSRSITYAELTAEVKRAANVLLSLGIGQGDRVAIYLPMIPEAVIAMLAVARVGAVHTVIFGGFSSESLRSRIDDASAKLVITADGGWRKGKVFPLKGAVDGALAGKKSTVGNVLVVRRGENVVDWVDGRDRWWHEELASADAEHEAEAFEAENPLFILYTSGTTGKPKGIVHTTGGYLTGVTCTTKMVFDLKEDDVYWCTADIGWVTGHSYVVYGPLANGATVVMYEGAPDWPKKNRLWEIIERYGVSVFYTAPTAIRAFMKWGTDWPAHHDLSSLRLLGSVGEPINPEAWIWYHLHIGGSRCPIVDTWWQTETGAIMITPLPGITKTKPGSATHAFPGISAEILTDKGEHVPVGGGLLAITKPWPSMLRTIYGDHERYQTQYWSRWGKDIYFTGDGAKKDDEGYYWLLGRVDDVLNVAGHRIGTMEVESALVDHPKVAEAAVVGRTHEIKGHALAAFVTVKEGVKPSEDLADELKRHVAHKIGAIARPDDIIFSADLPKTRSGKIMRRLLRDIAEGKALGDTTTLADPSVVAKLKEQYESQE